MADLHGEIQRFLELGERQVRKVFAKVGDEAVEENKTNHKYQNRTGMLESSNYSALYDDGLVIGNDAPYASFVESKGHSVTQRGILLAKKRLGEYFDVR